MLNLKGETNKGVSNQCPVRIFYCGACHSFVSSRFASRLGVKPVAVRNPYHIANPSREIMTSRLVYKDCVVEIAEQEVVDYLPIIRSYETHQPNKKKTREEEEEEEKQINHSFIRVKRMDLLSRNVEANELLQAQAHVWNHIFSFINSMSLKCAIQLGIPDIIHKHAQPMTLAELMDALPINNSKAPFIYRLMRILTHSGFFIKAKIARNNDDDVGEEVYMLNSASKLLMKDHALSMRPFLTALLDPILTDPFHHLSQWFQNTDETPFHSLHGRSLWELAGDQPELNHFFNEAMASDAHLVSNVVIKYHRHVFEGLNSLVDVGGGTGTMAMAIAEAFPQVKCTVLDLPHVVDGLEGNNKNLAFVGGDMFEAIPPADAVFMKWMLHNWTDEECVHILKKCKEAIPSKEKGGKLIMMDMVLNNQPNGDDEAIETQLFFDMMLMTLTKGRERNEKEWTKLFFEAGFNDYKITSVLGLRSIIEVYH